MRQNWLRSWLTPQLRWTGGWASPAIQLSGLSGLAALAVLLVVTTPGLATAEEPPDLFVKAGSGLFVRHCASCHGVDGQGDGPVAPVMRTKPADLTRIALRRGGEFPSAEIARTIDGRFAVAAHGPREMPVWGWQFGKGVESDATAEEIVRGNISVLVDYLREIQVKE